MPRASASWEPDGRETTMFGGAAFLVGGNMAVTASGEGGAVVRVDPAQADHLVDTTPAELAIMRGRPMQGWLQVPSADLRTEHHLATWVQIGVTYTRSLPTKSKSKKG